MDMLNVVMQFDGQVFFVEEEAAEAVSENYILSWLVFYGEGLLLYV